MAVTTINRNGRDYTALIVLDEQRKFTELSVFEPEEERILDQIVVARVDKAVSGIHAAFVHISPTQKAYLPLEHLNGALFTRKQSQKKEICEGDELVVQVTKEAVKTKDPVVSAKLTLTGKYCLLMPAVPEENEAKNIENPDAMVKEESTSGDAYHNKYGGIEAGTKGIRFSISRKIKGENRKRLLLFWEKLQEELYVPKQDPIASDDARQNPARAHAGDNLFCNADTIHPYEILLRTNSLQASLKELREDILAQIRQWENICRKAPHQSAYALLNAPLTGYIRQMQSLSYDDIDFVYTDDRAVYEDIMQHLPYLHAQGKLIFYQDDGMPLSVLYHIKGNIDSLMYKKVWLPSGGNLIIEQVETMTVIDVNSAKSSANRAAMLQANLEAAVEIPRQLRLRNISGMIIVDFINMDESTADEEQFLVVLKKELRKDTVPANFVDITKLGLVEITRKKIRRSLKEVFSS